jgi:hypothetical protein
MAAATDLAPEQGIAPAYMAFGGGLSRATFYRYCGPKGTQSRVLLRPKHPRTLDATEHQNVLDVLPQKACMHKAPREFMPPGRRRLSVLSQHHMYRILGQEDAVRERRWQPRMPLIRHALCVNPPPLCPCPNSCPEPFGSIPPARMRDRA